MRFFNTAGPVNPEDHYCLPLLERFELNEILTLIEQKKYFVLHAPRQTGKTSLLLALTDYLNAEGKYACLYVNVESAQAAREDVAKAMRAILGTIGSGARNFLKDDFPIKHFREIIELCGEHGALDELLSQWSQNSSKPIVMMMDEIDSLVGDTLISVLRQIRSGYTKRPALFPQSIILCGVRDVRDYRIHTDAGKAAITGGSAFNIKSKSLRLGNFSASETEQLLHQHTQETGQTFADEAMKQIWDLTCGQPWLVNALAYEACFEIREGRNRSTPISSEMIVKAKENLILRRETHLDQLVDKLKEERVRRVIGPVIMGKDMLENVGQDDIQYLLDLGLIRKSHSGLEIANPIYREIIPRELALIAQYNLEPRFEPAWYVLPDGSLDMNKLLSAFQEFFRENSEVWIERFDYKEAGPHLLLQAFLQRIINSGGRIEREYGLGRMRTDLLVIMPVADGVRKVVIELKILHKSLEATLSKGLEQTCQYMDRCGTNQGHLIIFDRSPEKSWEEKIFLKEETVNGKTITIWGM